MESFNGKLRDELLDREMFDTLLEAKVLIERWRREYNAVRPHSALGYRPPAPEVVRVGPPATAPAPWLIGTTLTSGLVSSVGAGEVLTRPPLRRGRLRRAIVHGGGRSYAVHQDRACFGPPRRSR